MSIMMRIDEQTETMDIAFRERDRLTRTIKMLIAAAITLAAIGLGLLITKENAALIVILAFLGLLSTGLSESGMRDQPPTSIKPDWATGQNGSGIRGPRNE